MVWNWIVSVRVLDRAGWVMNMWKVLILTQTLKKQLLQLLQLLLFPLTQLQMMSLIGLVGYTLCTHFRRVHMRLERCNEGRSLSKSLGLQLIDRLNK